MTTSLQFILFICDIFLTYYVTYFNLLKMNKELIIIIIAIIIIIQLVGKTIEI